MLLATYWESRDDDVVASSEDANEDAETGIVFVVVDSPMVVLWPNMGGSSLALSTIFLAGLPLLDFDFAFPGIGLLSDLGVLLHDHTWENHNHTKEMALALKNHRE